MSSDNNLMILNQSVEIPYSWSMGNVIYAFFEELKENGRIRGTKCSVCGTVMVPPQGYCGPCFAEAKEWVDVKDEGVLTTFTVVQDKYFDDCPDVPFAFGLVKLDGADTAMAHLVKADDYSQLRVGARVRAEWKMARAGNLFDINYFVPVE